MTSKFEEFGDYSNEELLKKVQKDKVLCKMIGHMSGQAMQEIQPNKMQELLLRAGGAPEHAEALVRVLARLGCWNFNQVTAVAAPAVAQKDVPVPFNPAEVVFDKIPYREDKPPILTVSYRGTEFVSLTKDRIKQMYELEKLPSVDDKELQSTLVRLEKCPREDIRKFPAAPVGYAIYNKCKYLYNWKELRKMFVQRVSKPKAQRKANTTENIVLVVTPQAAAAPTTAPATAQITATTTEQVTLRTTEQATTRTTEQAQQQQATAGTTEQATARTTEQAPPQATARTTEQATARTTEQATARTTARTTEQAPLQATARTTARTTEQAQQQATARSTARTQPQQQASAATVLPRVTDADEADRIKRFNHKVAQILAQNSRSLNPVTTREMHTVSDASTRKRKASESLISFSRATNPRTTNSSVSQERAITNSA